MNQLYTGFMGGRFPPLRRLGSPALLGDLEDDTAGTGGPLDLLQFVNDDTAIWSGTGDLVIALTHVPWSDSLQVKLNGHELEPSEWTYDSSLNTVTIPAQTWWDAGEEVGTAYYAYLEADDPDEPLPVSVNVVDRSYPTATAPTVTWNAPTLAEPGNLLLAILLVPIENDDVTLNGWALVGQTDATGGTQPYRLMVFTKVYDGSSVVPSIPNALSDSDPFGVMLALDAGSSVAGIFGSVVVGTDTASTPAGGSTFRVWGALSGTATLLSEAASGEVVELNNGATAWTSADLLVTQDSATGAVAAEASATVTTGGWLLATLEVLG